MQKKILCLPGFVIKASLLFAALFVLACSSGEIKGTANDVSSLLNQFSGDPVVPREANTIYIEPFSNASSMSGLEERFMPRFYTLIAADGRLGLVKNEDDADITMQGSIYSFEIQNITYNTFGQPDKKRVRVLVNIKLLNNKKERIIFNDPEIQAFTEFSEITPPIMSEFQAVEAALDNLAGRLLSKTINGWYTDQMLNFEKGQK